MRFGFGHMGNWTVAYSCYELENDDGELSINLGKQMIKTNWSGCLRDTTVILKSI